MPIINYSIHRTADITTIGDRILSALFWFVLGAMIYGPLAGHVVNIYTCSVWPSEVIDTGLSANKWRE